MYGLLDYVIAKYEDPKDPPLYDEEGEALKQILENYTANKDKAWDLATDLLNFMEEVL
jgi:hypothetical protein